MKNKNKKNNKENKKRIHIIVDAELHRKFKMMTAAEGKKMTEVIIEFIKDYIKGRRIK